MSFDPRKTPMTLGQTMALVFAIALAAYGLAALLSNLVNTGAAS